MTRQGPRLHRLQPRTDYVLIPPPLDLSLPQMTEKSPLPAIIVTPSSPCSPRDFSIAFLAAPAKPTIRERFASYKHLNTPSLRLRSILIVLLIIFVLVCHLVTHRLAARRPHLEFVVQTGDVHVVGAQMHWFDFRSLFGGEAPVEQVHREFIVSDTPGAR